MVKSRERADTRRSLGGPSPDGPGKLLIALGALLVVVIVAGVLFIRRPPAGPAPVPGEPAPPVELEPPSGRLGLHVTEEELAIWRTRAETGPYRESGDVSQNSPGDWVRVTEYSEAFLADPDAGRWQGPVKNNVGGCVLRDGGQAGDLGYQPPILEPSQLLDAAFYAMVTESRPHAEAVKAELLAQARVPGVDFADRNRWCIGEILDGSPGFMVANWLTKFVFAADYLEAFDPAIFSPEERGELARWCFHGAAWMCRYTDIKIE